MAHTHRALLNDNYFEDFYLCHCEKQKYPPGFLSDMWVRDHYTICYVISGKGRLRFGRQELALSAGQGVLLLPGRACRYQADPDSLWHCLRVGFAGKEAEAVLLEMNFHAPGRRFFCSNIAHIDELTEKLLSETRGTLPQIFLRQSLLYEFFSTMIEDFEEEGHLEGGFNDYIIQAIKWIRDHFGEHDLRVSDIADHLGISRNYLFTLFKEAMNHSPQEYITSFRLSRARELLAGTEYSIDGISYSCGYEDPAVFSRAFKKKYHITPSGYRARILQEFL